MRTKRKKFVVNAGGGEGQGDGIKSALSIHCDVSRIAVHFKAIKTHGKYSVAMIA